MIMDLVISSYCLVYGRWAKSWDLSSSDLRAKQTTQQALYLLTNGTMCPSLVGDFHGVGAVAFKQGQVVAGEAPV